MRAWVVVLLWLISAEVAFAQDDVPAPAAPRPHDSLRGDDPIGGSADIGTQIRWDAEPKRALLRRDPLERWFQWKDCFAKRTGLNWQANYNFLYMKASESLGHREAAGGIFELNATWDLVNRHSPNKGILGFRLESRHKLGTEIAPAALGGEIGSLWRPDVLWSERDFSLSQLWWEQRFLRGRAAVRLGKLISPAVIYDNFVLRVPQLALQGEPWTFSATPFPDNGLGISGVVFPSSNWYVLAGIHDANAFIEESGFDSIQEGEFFKAIEFGWTPAFEKRKTDNYHVTLWHVDRLSESGRPEGWGGTVSFQRYVCERWLPFVRYSYAANDVLPIEHLAQGGLGYRIRDHDSVALGFSYATPSDDTLNDQYGIELYYRVYVTRALSIIPGFHSIWRPARNPTEDQISLISLRVRLSL